MGKVERGRERVGRVGKGGGRWRERQREREILRFFLGVSHLYGNPCMLFEKTIKNNQQIDK